MLCHIFSRGSILALFHTSLYPMPATRNDHHDVSPYLGHVERASRLNRMNGIAGFCPCCGYVGKMNSVLMKDLNRSRENAECPVCQARERHRLTCFEISRLDWGSKNIRLLHFGPQRQMEETLSKIVGIDQISMDFFQETETGRYQYSKKTHFGDVTSIPFPDAFLDAIIILHVLEHVPEVGAALVELRRVLKLSGLLIVEVPCSSERNDSRFCGTNSTAAERVSCGGQNDHYWNFSCAGFFALLKHASLNCTTPECSEIDMHGKRRVWNSDSGLCSKLHHKGMGIICRPSQM